VADIGIPRVVLNRARTAASRVEAADVRALVPRRPLRVHKYTAGTALVIGGSRRYTGAPVMTAQAALVAGAGAVLLGIPAGIREIVAKRVLEVMLAPVPEHPEGGLGPASWDALREALDRADAVAAGPGLGLHPETRAFTVRLVEEVRVPLVLDADALTMLAEERSILRRRKHGTVLTPHTGELSRLTGENAAAIDADRVGAARRAARRFNAVVVLKGPGTVTASPEGRVVVNSTGNPAMATAGSGDVLTGLIASLAAQGVAPFEAAFAGVFLHGLAGDLAMGRRGGGTLVAGDISAEIPQALAALSGA
jgi:NAD(P)H-hydrate epimerase